MRTNWLLYVEVRFRCSQEDLLTHTKCSSPLIPTTRMEGQFTMWDQPRPCCVPFPVQ